MKKRFKIGEYAIGGIIEVVSEKDKIKISALDWISKDEILTLNFNPKDTDGMDNFLNELTTSYYADKVLQYIKQ